MAQENIFAPLGIKDVEWNKSPFDGLATSSEGLNLRPRDWAKIGQLVLNRGVWEDKQIVPAAWVAQSTTEQIKTEGPLAYGYLWWLGRSPDKDGVVQWIAASGFKSQKTIIIPALDMVVVINASRLKTWLRPSWTCWIDGSYPRLQRIDFAWRRAVIEASNLGRTE